MGQISTSELITVVSTYTTDLVPNGAGGETPTPGGPATYIGAALKRLGTRSEIISGVRPTVRVIRTPTGEEYVIPRLPPIPMPTILSGDAAILSPIMAEIPPEHVPPVEGLLVIDLQGFVREPDRPMSQVSRMFDLESLIQRADVVKASEEELDRLTWGSRQLLANTLLLVTLGASGSRILDHGARHEIRAEVVQAPNTIGAGDNYLAAFTLALLRGAPVEEAGKEAARFTSDVLRERLRA